VDFPGSAEASSKWFRVEGLGAFSGVDAEERLDYAIRPRFQGRNAWIID
jgi:hypothetical protein